MASTPSASRVQLVIETACAVLLGLGVLWVLGARLVHAGFFWDLWPDRDLVRAAQLATTWPTSGAELSYGGGAKVPGGLLYLLFALPLSVSQEASDVFRFQALLDAVGVGLLGLFLGWRWGRLAGAMGAAAMVVAGASQDVLAHLWNPGLLSLPMVLAHLALWRWVGDRDARALPALALAVALGAQLHMSALLWFVACLPAVLWVRPVVGGQALAWSAAAVGLAYAPYLASELLRGAPNTLALLDQSEVRQAASGRGGLATFWQGLQEVPGALSLGSFLVDFVPEGAPWRVALQLPLVAGLVFAGGMAWRALRRKGEGDDRAVLAVLVGMVGVGLAYAWDEVITIRHTGNGRYVAILVPSLGVVVAVVGRGVRSAAWRTGLAVLACAALGVHLVQTRDAVVALGHGAVGVGAWQTRLQALQAFTGLPLDDVVARTVVLGRNGGSWSRDTRIGVAWWLHQAGLTHPGSRTGECFALVVVAPSEDDLPRLEVPGGVVIDVAATWEPLPGSGSERILRYRTDGPCLTSFSQRYIDTEAEAAAHPWWGRLDPDEVVELPAPAGVTARRVFRLAPDMGQDAEPVDILAVVDVRAEGGAVSATLESNQLRGEGFNSGWFGDAEVDGPRLVLTDAEGRQVVAPWAPGRVGRDGVFTPLVVSVDPGPGVWHLAFEAHVPRLAGSRGAPVRQRGVDAVVPLGVSLDLR